jgi:hypothetical protein
MNESTLWLPAGQHHASMQQPQHTPETHKTLAPTAPTGLHELIEALPRAEHLGDGPARVQSFSLCCGQRRIRVALICGAARSAIARERIPAVGSAHGSYVGDRRGRRHAQVVQLP